MENEEEKLSQELEAIINLPHHVSKHHPQMTLYQRAAQFTPFAALTGHEEAIAETAIHNTLEHEKRNLEDNEEINNH